MRGRIFISWSREILFVLVIIIHVLLESTNLGFKVFRTHHRGMVLQEGSALQKNPRKKGKAPASSEMHPGMVKNDGF